MKQMIRHVPSLFWIFLEQTAATGIPRLVLFPLAAYFVGKNDFGLFATALSVVLIIGNQPANGLAVGLLRNLSHYKGHEQNELNSTAVRMCHKFLLYFLSTSLVVLVGVVAAGLIETTTYLCLTILAISLYAENEFMLILTPLRYQRKFKEHAFWFVASAFLILFFGVAGCYLGGIVGLVLGMMAANFIMCGMAAKAHFEAKLDYNADHAKMLRWTWVHLTIAGMLVLAGPHLNRIVLRLYSDNESVADFFAATAITYVFIAPIYNSATWLLSMISKYNVISEIPGYVYKALLVAMVGASAAGMLLYSVTAPLVLDFLFPGFGNRASDLFGILIWMIPASIVMALVRPFITKFADVIWIPRINFAVLLAMLILMFSLIPRWGLDGAAWSISIGCIVAAVLRVVVFCILYI